MCIAEVITVTKDAVLTIGAIVASYVALRGLNTWNRQLKGGVEYDLTRRLLRCTYKLREAMKGVRNPVMFGGEIPNPPEEEGKEMSADERRYYGTSQAYQRRWDKVSEVRNELQTELLEGEVIWGKVIHEKFEPLFALQRELFSDVHSYLVVCNPSEHEDSRRAMSEIRRKHREVLYSGLGDPFSEDVEKIITDIETFLKPHLRK
ncbi:MAG: hypothetical protein ACYDC8_00810 [Gammaproteobacteria bacterium]